MAAEDPTETFVATHESAPHGGDVESRATLVSAVTEWLAGRTVGSPGDVTVSVAVLPGRWLLRVDSGASGSTLDYPSRTDCSAAEVASAVRRWARVSGLSARVDAQR